MISGSLRQPPKHGHDCDQHQCHKKSLFSRMQHHLWVTGLKEAPTLHKPTLGGHGEGNERFGRGAGRGGSEGCGGGVAERERSTFSSHSVLVAPELYAGHGEATRALWTHWMPFAPRLYLEIQITRMQMGLYWCYQHGRNDGGNLKEKLGRSNRRLCLWVKWCWSAGICALDSGCRQANVRSHRLEHVSALLVQTITRSDVLADPCMMAGWLLEIVDKLLLQEYSAVRGFSRPAFLCLACSELEWKRWTGSRTQCSSGACLVFLLTCQICLKPAVVHGADELLLCKA